MQNINKENLNLEVNPVEDFYEYACGGWIKNHPIKKEFARYGNFDVLNETARKQLKELIMGLGENPEVKVMGSVAQKIYDLYNMGMDVDRLNAEGVKPLLPVLEKIETFSKDKLTEFVSWLHYALADVFFSSGVGVDAKDSDAHLYHLGEVGLGLGDRDYYLEKNETNQKILEGYEKYVRTIMTLAGYSEKEAERIWETVIKLETEFAEHKRTREEKRNPQLLYNIFTIDELKDRYKYFDWDLYFKNLGISPKKVNISNPAFFDFIGEKLAELTDQEIIDYILYETVSGATGLLGEAFEDADFEFYGRLMSGIEEKRPRWKKAMAIPNSMFGEAIGQLYVDKYFPPENKEYMKGLVANLKLALADHIKALTWMSDETKEKAIEKLDSLKVKIGYPDKWKDYSEINIDPEKSYWENVFKASEWFSKDSLSKLDKPVDKEEWHMYPQTVNAYYSPINNEICFPAGILQPPFFNAQADDALNYGAIGVVIGHEITHGFDDQGRQFDKKGNLTNWWTEDDEKRFNELADKLVDLFDKVEVAPGVHANGRYTLGENIADQGGLRVALTAYRKAMKDKEWKDMDGLTPLQRFYLAYAQVWASTIREEEKLVRTKSDPHSLEKNRVNETLKNIAEFFEAFGIKEGDKMYRPEEERVIIW